jgi:hypothetical protein
MDDADWTGDQCETLIRDKGDEGQMTSGYEV